MQEHFMKTHETQFCVRLITRSAALEFACTKGSSVLESAEAQGIYIPSSCRNGTCRTCMTQLHSGTVSYTVEWPGLSAEERASGWVLPCVACAESDLVMHNSLSYAQI